MDNEIEEKKNPVLMKSGLVHWVSEPTWRKISDIVSSQNGHRFIQIAELGGISVNTAEVEGVYTEEQYEDITRLKQGMWQCTFKKWHKKKGECECRQEFLRKRHDEKVAAEEAAGRVPETEQERREKFAALQETRRELEGMGILPKKA